MSVPKRLPFGFAQRNGVLLSDEGDHPTVFYRSGLTRGVVAEVLRFAGTEFEFRSVDDSTFDQKLSSSYQNDSVAAMQMIEDVGDDMDLDSIIDSLPETGDLLEQEDDAPIIKVINSVLTEAVKVGASDVHVETYETRLVIRFRVDGILREVVSPRRALAPLLVSRIKVMAKLNIAEKRLPQDGRISLLVGGKEVGMNDADLKAMLELVHKPHGIILVTGPTGSGKSTTLYACLDQLNDRSRNILTVEDPIEYDVEGIGQTQVNLKADMTFAKGLRAILRQDPDVVMVGEIRDFETADISVQSSLTGHLVLSTIHTNTAVGALTRLENMGVQPYLLSNSIIGLVAQRLIRVLCPDCRESYVADEYECAFLKVTSPPTLYRSKGCDNCDQQGYRGRMGIYEVVLIDDELRRMVHSRVSELDIEEYARGRTTGIRDDGRAKVLDGLTTIDEVLRVTMED